MLLVTLVAFQSQRSAIALTYHDVTPRKTVWFDCTPTEFRSQIDAMRKAGARFVSLAQLEAYLLRGVPLPPRAVAITFSDNYRGFLTYAYPVLKAHGIPSAMFVHTGFVGSKVGRPKMTWDELRRLDREGLVTVASQTVTHRELVGLSGEEVWKELRGSKAMLERQLGHPIRYLAYPEGRTNGMIEGMVESSGLYKMAFGEIQAPIRRPADRWQVNRYVHTRWRQALRDARIR